MSDDIDTLHQSLTDKQIALLRHVKSKDVVKDGQRRLKGKLSVTVDRPHMPTVNKLVRKGLLKNIMDTFWQLTPKGEDVLALHDENGRERTKGGDNPGSLR